MNAIAAITGIGALTPVGLSAPSTCAALRAGVSRLELFAGWTEALAAPDPAPTVGRVPLEHLAGYTKAELWPGHRRFDVVPPKPLQWVTPGPERLIELGVPAATEAWYSAEQRDPRRDRLGIFVGVDSGVDGGPLLAALSEALRVIPTSSAVFAQGRAAAYAAVQHAARELASGTLTRAVVGGVDSLLREAPLTKLADEGALLSEGSPGGRAVGEAAAFVVLEPPRASAAPLALLASCATSVEPSTRAERPNEGAGLTEALRAARRGAASRNPLPRIICDLTGDRYRASEWLLASVRAFRDWPPDAAGPGLSDVWHPADCIGDSGAASGALSLVWATIALARGYARSRDALAWGASDGPLRAAAILTRADAARA